MFLSVMKSMMHKPTENEDRPPTFSQNESELKCSNRKSELTKGIFERKGKAISHANTSVNKGGSTT